MRANIAMRHVWNAILQHLIASNAKTYLDKFIITTVINALSHALQAIGALTIRISV
jgi:hypothetical protein